MYNGKKYHFFKCYNCGEWYYSNRIIKSKKCWKCNHSFSFKNSTKFTKICSIRDAISIVKKLKDNIKN
ncbi:MAG: DUF1922 domain-containing protein [Candidatus Lokiarchaeota archaeon]|nr:DUF1922 domain-containing protein [Candidatus Lokiarchaeota archaeon]